MFLAKQWLNHTVLNALMSIRQNHPGTTTQMVRILGLDSLTCYLWFILNIVQNAQLINLYHGKFLAQN